MSQSSPSPDLQARLRKAAAMMRRGNKQLWSQDIEAMAHRRGCADPEHYGCNALQAVEAMENAADLLREAASSRPPSPSPELEQRVSDYRSGYSAGWADGKGGSPMADAEGARRFFHLPETTQACSNCGCEERDHRGILTCRCPERPAALPSTPSPQPSAEASEIGVCGHVGSGASPEAPPSTPSGGVEHAGKRDDICYCRRNPCICFRHDTECEAELTSHGYTPCRCEERDTLRTQRDEAVRIAKEATNGWACYAKRQAEHDEIARLHRAIAKAEGK